MYETATGMDEYEWPRCTACTHELWENEAGRLVCRPCEDKAAVRLRELGPLFVRLDSTAALMKGGRRSGSSPSGSRVPPLPVSLAVLNLAAVGGVATRLQAIEDSWRQALGWSMGDGIRPLSLAVGAHLRFLAANLLWACDSYPEVAQDLEEIRRLHSEATAALSAERRPGRVKIGHCPARYDDGTRCAQSLTATATSHRIRCGACGRRWDDMDAWRALRRDQEAMYAEMAGVAA